MNDQKLKPRILLSAALLAFFSLFYPLKFWDGGMAVDYPESIFQRYEASERLSSEVRYRIHRNWDGQGQVLIGRLVPPPEVEISRRATIYEDGSFATAVYPGRTLEFYAHGYEPLVITKGELVAGSVFDAGEHEFRRSPAAHLRQLRANLHLQAATPESPPVSATLEIPNDATLSRDHGHWQHRTSPVALRAELPSGAELRFDGLSPIPYELVLRAPGYIEQRVEIDPQARGLIDLSDLKVLQAKTLRFTYLSQIEPDQPAGWPAPDTVEILCNGRNQFQFTEHRDEFRNRMRLRLYPEPNGVEAGFPWVPAEYYDLGPGRLADFQEGRKNLQELGASVSRRRLPLKDGHVYFFRHERKGVNCLFQVEEL